MKTFLFVILLIATSYAFEKSNSMEEIVQQLVELNASVGAPSDKIGGIVASITSASRDSQKAFTAFSSGINRNCGSGTTLLDEFVNKLKGDQVTMSTGINNAKAAIVVAERNAKNYAKQIKDAKEELRKDHIREQKERAEHEKHIREAENKLIIVRHLKNIINDELVNASNEASPKTIRPRAAMLVQLNTFSEKLNELKDLLTEASDSMFSVVVSSLLQTVTEKNFSDQGVLMKILSALKKIKTNLKAWMRKSTKERSRLNDIHHKQTASKLASLRSLGKLLVEARSDKTSNEKAIQEFTASQAGIANALKRKNRELAFFGKQCNSQSTLVKEINTQFAQEEAIYKRFQTELLKLN